MLFKKTAKLGESLKDLKSQLKDTISLKNTQQQEIYSKDTNYKAFLHEMKNLTVQVGKLNKKNEHLNVHKNKIAQNKSNKMDISTFVSDKLDEKSKICDINNLKRKISIYLPVYEQAKKFLEVHESTNKQLTSEIADIDSDTQH